MIEVRDGKARSFKTIANRRRGESSRIFDAVESLFLGSRDELAITHQCRRGIRVIGIDSQNIHKRNSAPALQLAAASAAEPSERSALESASSICLRTHSLSTKRLHGRAQPVRLSKNLRHTRCTSSPSNIVASEDVRTPIWQAMSAPSLP